MSVLNNLLSGFLKDKMEDITSVVKDKIEDVIEDALHPDEEGNVTVTVAEEITVQSLYHRLGDVQVPMTGEEFIRRMSSAGFEAQLFELSENERKGIPVEVLERFKQYSARKANDSAFFYVIFFVYREETEAIRNMEGPKNNFKNSENNVFLAEEEGRFFIHSTLVAPNETYKMYQLYSRIGNTVLQVTMPEENADAYAADIVKALQGSGY